MSYETLLVEISANKVATITLNRPDNYNTFTFTLARELDSALWDLDSNPDVRVIVIKGAGKVFCAGIDVKDFFDKTAMEYREWVECMERPLVSISKLTKPVIAQVHGVAAANGMGLVAACDLAVAGEKARMGLTAINVGLNCVGPVVAVRRSIGRKKALELLLFGELIGADEALQLGLVNKVVPDEKLDEETRAWAEKLAEKSPIAVKLAKTGYYVAEDMDYYRAFDYMNEVFTRLCCTEDAKEGVKAFLEKRKPEWKER